MNYRAHRVAAIAAFGILASGSINLSATAASIESTGGGGFIVKSDDGAFTSQFGGRLQFQADAFHDRDAAASNGGGTTFRRLRLYAAGTLYENWRGKVEIDFSSNRGNGDTNIRDAYLDYTGFSKYFVDDLLIGQTKPPFGLEELTSSKYITFVERNVASGAISIDERRIITAAGSNDFFHYQIAAYDLDNGDASGDNNVGNSIGYGGRFTIAPLHASDQVLHLGIASAYEPNNGGNISNRPEARLADSITVVDTSSNRSDRTKLGFEAATVLGPFSLQGEYQKAYLDADNGAGQDTDVEGYYVFGTFFLTGESRPYDVASGTFGRVKPKNDPGAVELVVRYSRLRNEDAPGEIEGITGGLNWYLKSNIRVAANYIRSDITDSQDRDRDVDSYIAMVFYDF